MTRTQSRFTLPHKIFPWQTVLVWFWQVWRCRAGLGTLVVGVMRTPGDCRGVRGWGACCNPSSCARALTPLPARPRGHPVAGTRPVEPGEGERTLTPTATHVVGTRPDA